MVAGLRSLFGVPMVQTAVDGLLQIFEGEGSAQDIPQAGAQGLLHFFRSAGARNAQDVRVVSGLGQLLDRGTQIEGQVDIESNDIACVALEVFQSRFN